MDTRGPSKRLYTQQRIRTNKRCPDQHCWVDPIAASGIRFFTCDFSMSDFPKGGDIQATRNWLDQKGFTGKFLNWKADAILGKDDAFIKSKFENTPEEQDKAEALCGLLNMARRTPPQAQGDFIL